MAKSSAADRKNFKSIIFNQRMLAITIICEQPRTVLNIEKSKVYTQYLDVFRLHNHC
jgi:GH43 family beta-xylosidase